MSNIAISQLSEAGALTGDEIIQLSQLSPTVTITGTTISALASDNSFNDSANGFASAGFAPGDRVKVVGFTGNVVNNIFSALITALTSAKMTIGGTDGDVIVDDAAGESVTITKWVSKRVELDEVTSGAGVPPGGTTGQVLTKQSGTDGDADWEDPTGGGTGDANGAAGFPAPLTVDTPPSVPNAIDDEFEDAALDSKWAWRNQGGATADLVGGCLLLTAPASAGATNVRGLEQAISGTFKVRMKIRQNVASTNYATTAIYVANNSNGRIAALGFNYTSGNRIEGLDLTNATTFHASLTGGAITYIDETRPNAIAFMYFEIEVTSTHIIARYSYNGFYFIQAYSVTIASYLGAVDRIGISANSENSSPAVSIVDWFRRIDGASAPKKISIGSRTPYGMQNTALSAGIADPTSDLSFDLEERKRYWEMIGSNFYQARDELGFDAKLYTDLTEAGSITYSWAAGKMKMQFTGGTTLHAFKRYMKWMPEVPHFAMQVRVDTRGAASNYNGVGFVARKDSNNFIQAIIDGTNAWIEKKVGGSSTSPIGSNTSFSWPTAPFWLGVTIINDTWSLYYRTASDRPWLFVCSAAATGIDFRDPAVMADYDFGFHAFSGENTTWEFSDFRAGYFGGVGIRDVKPVTYRNGSPYTVGGYHYFTATFGCPGVPQTGPGVGIPYSHTGVFRYNFLTKHLEKTAALFVNRSGLNYSDGTGKIVYDDALGCWRVLMGTWANGFGGALLVAHQTFTGDVLNGVHVLKDLATITLGLAVGGSPIKGAYDQDLIYDDVDAVWRLAYTYTPDTTFPSAPMYIAQDTSPDFTTWTNVLADSSHASVEGTCFFKYDGVIYLAGASLSTNRVYDARTNTYIGALAYSRPTPAVVNIIAHPCLVPVMVQGRTRTFLVTFDGTPDASNGDSSWSTLVIQPANEVETGFEYPARGVT